MSIIPAGVYPEMFEGKDGDIMRNKYGIGTRPLVIYTGTLDNFQRIDLLLKAMQIVVNKIGNALLLAVGNIINPSDLSRNKKIAEDLGIDKNVIFTDERPLEEIPYFLASADVAVVPRPTTSGFPVKLLNYMAAGKAIVTFEGSAKGLKHMFNAIVARNDNWEELGKGILTLLMNPALASELGKNARKTIEGNFDWNSLAKKIEKIYDEVLNPYT
jgi:glycosyltransferase involved in cell wall biosynthesis